MNIDGKNPQQTKFGSILKGLYPCPHGTYSWNARMAPHMKIIQLLYHINRKKGENHMII